MAEMTNQWIDNPDLSPSKLGKRKNRIHAPIPVSISRTRLPGCNTHWMLTLTRIDQTCRCQILYLNQSDVDLLVSTSFFRTVSSDQRASLFENEVKSLSIEELANRNVCIAAELHSRVTTKSAAT
jgi:hypothetical protein